MSEEPAKYGGHPQTYCVCCGKPMEGHLPSRECLEWLTRQVETLRNDLARAGDEIRSHLHDKVQAEERWGRLYDSIKYREVGR